MNHGRSKSSVSNVKNDPQRTSPHHPNKKDFVEEEQPEKGKKQEREA
jgi:hypothetical protein